MSTLETQKSPSWMVHSAPHFQLTCPRLLPTRYCWSTPLHFVRVTSQCAGSTQSNPHFSERFLSLPTNFPSSQPPFTMFFPISSHVFPYFPISSYVFPCFSACLPRAKAPGPVAKTAKRPQDCNLSGEEMQRLARWALEESRRSDGGFIFASGNTQ